MQKYSLLSSFFLATTFLLSSSNVNAMLIDKDEDIIGIEKSAGKFKYLKEKTKKQAEAHRLSDKGDIRCYIDGFQDPILRRMFFTLGDGDCLFWTNPNGITRERAIQIWLESVEDEEMRRIAHKEILDAFMIDAVGERNLRKELNRILTILEKPLITEDVDGTNLFLEKQKLQNNLDEAQLSDVIKINIMGYRPLPQAMREKPLYQELKNSLNLYQVLIDEAEVSGNLGDKDYYTELQDELKNRIKREYCLNKETQIDYIKFCLSGQDHFIYYPPGDETYFINVLAYRLNQNLIAWTPSENPQGFVRAHYYPHPNGRNAGNWEVLHHGRKYLHYTRVVPVNDHAACAHALQKENETLKVYEQSKKEKNKFSVRRNFNAFKLSLPKNFSTATLSPEEEAEVRLVMKSSPNKPLLSDRQKAAFCHIFLKECIEKAEGIERKIDTKPSELSLKVTKDGEGAIQEKLRLEGILNNLEVLEAQRSLTVEEETTKKTAQNQQRTNNAKLRLYTTQKEQTATRMRQYEENLPTLKKDLLDVANEIKFHHETLQKLGIVSTEKEIADLKFQLALYYKQRTAKIGQNSSDYKDAFALQTKFGMASDEANASLLKKMQALDIAAMEQQAQACLHDSLARNLTFDYKGERNSDLKLTFNFTEDYKKIQAYLSKFQYGPHAKCFNFARFSHDPFLEVDKIHKLYPKDISDGDFKILLQSFYKDILRQLTHDYDYRYIENNIENLFILFSDDQYAKYKLFNNVGMWNEKKNPITLQNVNSWWLQLNGRRINFTHEQPFDIEARTNAIRKGQKDDKRLTPQQQEQLQMLLEEAKQRNEETSKYSLLETFIELQNVFHKFQQEDIFKEVVELDRHNQPVPDENGFPKMIKKWFSQDPLLDYKKTTRKRIKYLHDREKEKAVNSVESEDQEKLENLQKRRDIAQQKGGVTGAKLLVEQSQRCPDGVGDGLSILERQGKSQRCENAIARLLSDIVWNFCQSFADLFPVLTELSPEVSKLSPEDKKKAIDEAIEGRTYAPLLAKQRTFHSLPHTGEPVENFFYLPKDVHQIAHSILSPENLINLFFNGGQVRHPGTGRSIYIKPFTIEAFVDLFYGAYKKKCAEKDPALKNAESKSVKDPALKMFSIEAIVELLKQFPYMEHLYTEFSDEMAWSPPKSEYFGSQMLLSEAGNSLVEQPSIDFKKPFFDYLLVKFGYINDPNSPWKAEEKKFLTQEKKDLEEKITKFVGLTKEEKEPLSKKVNPSKAVVVHGINVKLTDCRNSQAIEQTSQRIKIVTDYNASASYQLESPRFSVQLGQKIKVPYNITVEPGGIMAVSLLNTNRDDWLYEQILKAGSHHSFFEVTVPKGEREASLVFRNYHLGTPGQTTFTINSVDIQQKAPEMKAKIGLNPTGLAQNIEHQKNGSIKVITDNNNWASYQLESTRITVKPGQKISIPYNITVEPGGIMSIGLLNTTRDGWFNEIVLKAGENQKGVLESIISPGEREASLVFRNYHLGTSGQTIFTINEVNMQGYDLLLM